tara:strand:+ start:44 stop:601 length:558 start_codon:yes stop_codon:yes gene_type:complete
MNFNIHSFNLDDGIKVEDHIEGIEKDTYYFFKTGGPHYFSNVDIDIDIGIYRELIWPFVIGNFKINNAVYKRCQLAAINNNGYPTIRLNKENSTFITFHKRDSKYVKKKLQFWNQMHRVVALCIIPNPSEDNTIVHHINENKLDYRPENLEWTTNKKNSHKGSKGNKISPTDIFNKIKKMEWFKK